MVVCCHLRSFVVIRQSILLFQLLTQTIINSIKIQRWPLWLVSTGFGTDWRVCLQLFPPICLCLADSALQSIFLLDVHKWNLAADFYFCYSLTFWSLKCCCPKVSPCRQWKQLSSTSAPMLIQPLPPGSRGAAAAVTHCFIEHFHAFTFHSLGWRDCSGPANFSLELPGPGVLTIGADYDWWIL